MLLFALPFAALAYWWLDTPGEWRTPVPNQPDQSVWLTTSLSGFMDGNLQVAVSLRDDPWLGRATDTCLGNFTSPMDVHITYSPTFEFEWITADSLAIYAQEHASNTYKPYGYGRWLVAVVVPSHRRAWRPKDVEAEQLRQR